LRVVSTSPAPRGFTGCQGKGCAELLVAAGAVAAASAVVSGSIVVAGNIVYWFEKEGRCRPRPSPDKIIA
jgi:homoaconitase/3-isopropylmalate dehydratase large subunit